MLKESIFCCYGNLPSRSDDSRVILALNHWTTYPTDFLLLPTIEHDHPCFSVILLSASTYQKATKFISKPLFQWHAAVPNDLCNWHYGATMKELASRACRQHWKGGHLESELSQLKSQSSAVLTTSLKKKANKSRLTIVYSPAKDLKVTYSLWKYSAFEFRWKSQAQLLPPRNKPNYHRHNSQEQVMDILLHQWTFQCIWHHNSQATDTILSIFFLWLE